MPLPPTPWIRTYDTPELYLGGYKSGLEESQIRQRGQIAAAEIAAKQQQIAQQGAIAQMEMDAKMKMAEASRNEEQQRLAIEQQYRQSQLGIEQDKLAQAQKAMEFKTQQAAGQAAAQMRIQARVKSGEDYNQVVMEEGPMAGAGYGPSGIASIQRAQQAIAPKELELREEGGKQFYRSSEAEPYKMVPGGGEDRVMAHAAYTSGLATIRKMEEEYRIIDKKNEKVAFKAMMDDEKRRVNSIAASKNIDVPFPNLGKANEIIRMTKDGRQAVFNSDTKQFIRYADE